MSKPLTTGETAQWLLERDDFLILTHRRPDGDTLGSAGALALGLRSHGKTAFLLYNNGVTERYEEFVRGLEAKEEYTSKYIITVDTASCDLFPDNAADYKERVDLCIDHHPSNKKYAEFLCLKDHKASCGEVIYDILLKMKTNIGIDIAERIYVAISTDTGCFSNGNTTSDSLFAASKLIEAGADNNKLNKILFRTKTRSRIKIESMITSSMEYHFDNKVAIAFITKAMMEEAEAVENDMDDIASIPTTVEGVAIGITIRELTSRDDCKISVRSSEPYDANAICRHFGGGGHKCAAGATVNKPVLETGNELLIILKELMTQM